ncbi:MAG TPA: DUF3788 family protein [Bacteroidales bacterium]|jgi:hypothetical protein|nr:DUF3788 family protein [Bacteroidales bacterium]
MTEKSTPVLTDKSVYPTDDILFSVTGGNMNTWNKIIRNAEGKYSGITKEWRYYNDGKQWLFKLQHKKKTVFWSSVEGNTFRITFYFGNKSEPVIEESDLPGTIKDQFRSAKTFGNMRPVTFIISDNMDIDPILKLIDLKTRIK